MKISFRDWYEGNLSEVVRDFSKLPQVEVTVKEKDFVFNDEEVWRSCHRNLSLTISRVSREDVNQCVKEKKKLFDEIPNGGYVSTFYINGDRYVFYCNREYGQEFKGYELEGVFSIEFRGPNSYKLTKSHSASHANMVYSHVISCVVRSMEMERALGGEVNGFAFDAFDREMGIVYDYFYKIYLKPRGYLRMEENLYLDRGYLRKLMSGGSDVSKRELLQGVLNGRKTADLDNLRKEKGIERRLGVYVNKIIMAKKKVPFVCFVRKMGIDYQETPYLDVLRLSGDDVYLDRVYLHEILDQVVDPVEVSRFVNILKANKYYAVSHQILDGLVSNFTNSPNLK